MGQASSAGLEEAGLYWAGVGNVREGSIGSGGFGDGDGFGIAVFTHEAGVGTHI